MYTKLTPFIQFIKIRSDSMISERPPKKTFLLRIQQFEYQTCKSRKQLYSTEFALFKSSKLTRLYSPPIRVKHLLPQSLRYLTLTAEAAGVQWINFLKIKINKVLGSGPVIHMLKYFHMWFLFRGDIHICKILQGSLTPWSQKRFL